MGAIMFEREKMLAFLYAVQSFTKVDLYQGMMPEWVLQSCNKDLLDTLLVRGCVSEAEFQLRSGNVRGLVLTDKGRQVLEDPDDAMIC